MWTVEKFRLVILVGSVAFMALAFIVCYAGQKIKERKGKAK